MATRATRDAVAAAGLRDGRSGIRNDPPDGVAELSCSLLGQNSKARKSARLTSAPTIVPCCPPSAMAGILPATSPSMIATAIHPGITQTGSHPISLIRIECSVKLSQMNRIAAVMTCHEVRLGIVPAGALWSACLAMAKEITVSG